MSGNKQSGFDPTRSEWHMIHATFDQAFSKCHPNPLAKPLTIEFVAQLLLV